MNSGGPKDISLGEATIYKNKKKIKGGLAVSNFYFKISKNTGGFKRISRPCGGGFPHNTILGAPLWTIWMELVTTALYVEQEVRPTKEIPSAEEAQNQSPSPHGLTRMYISQL